MDLLFPRLGIFLIAAAFLVVNSAGADLKQDVAPLVRRFESRYRAAHTLQATFLERYSENGRIVRVEAGTVFFRRSGRMRWEYEAPEKNLFLVDGKSAVSEIDEAAHRPERVVGRLQKWRKPLARIGHLHP